ncbi:MAG: PKD domain-containing protein [Bacteroidota bacterium]
MLRIFRLTLPIFLFLIGTSVSAQPVPCPLTVVAGPDTTISCNSCVTLNAIQTNPLKSTTTYTVTPTAYLPYSFNTGTAILVGTDDIYSPVLNLTFPFCFFGTLHTQAVVGANGQICFDLTQANQYCPWPISGPLPGSNNTATKNCIMGPNYDMDPGISGNIYYATYGTSPCRTFVVSWYNIPMFQCTTQICSQQIVLYESTNAIDVFIQNKPSCPTWNGDLAILGIENAAGNVFYTAPGYNGTQWVAQNVGYRFSPATVVPTVFTWYNNTTGAVVGTGQTVSVCPTATTSYTVKAVSTGDCDSLIATGIATVTVVPPYNPAFTETIRYGCTQDTVTFFNNSTGAIAIDSTYWDFGDGTNVYLEGAAALTSPPLHFYPSNGGTYTIKMVLINGVCTDTISQTINFVHSPLVVGYNVDHDTVCVGTPINFTSTSTGGGLTYTWHYGDGTNGVGSPSTHSYSTVGIFTAWLIVKDSVNCIDSVSKLIYIGQPPTVNAGPDLTTCIHDSIQLNVTYGPPGPAYTILWTNQFINNDTIANPTVSPPNTINYIVTVNDPTSGTLCSASDTVKVTVLQGYTLYNHDTTICKGSSVIIQATGDPSYSYTWVPITGVSPTNIINPTILTDTTTTYSLIASYPGCHDSITHLTITIQPIPQIYAGIDRAICSGDTVHLHATVVPANFNGYTYQWSPVGALEGSPGSVTDVIFNGLTDSTITVSVTTSIGCADTDTVHIIVWPASFAQLSPSNNVDMCPGQQIPFTVTGSGVSFLWTPGLYLTDSTSATPIASPVTNISYNLLVTDIHGCRDTFNISLFIHPEAVISLPDSVSIYPGETAMLDPQGNCLYFTWTPPLGLSSTNISNPVASPDVTTEYYVTGTTEYNCTAHDSIEVIVHPLTIIDMPNVFTPGTGPNGKLTLQKRGIAALKTFSIFNRWGNKVFETSDINEGWNGDYKGDPQPMGVYVYLIDGTTSDGTHFSEHGNITLIR